MPYDIVLSNKSWGGAFRAVTCLPKKQLYVMDAFLEMPTHLSTNRLL